MYEVDRSLALVRPKEPFQKWLNGLPHNDLELELDTMRADCTAFLLAEALEPEECVARIDEMYEKIFEMELGSWCDDRSLWPQDRSLKTFWEWFDVEIHSLVIDTLDEDIQNTPMSSGLLN